MQCICDCLFAEKTFYFSHKAFIRIDHSVNFFFDDRLSDSTGNGFILDAFFKKKLIVVHQ